MADVTISSLPIGTPSGSIVLPYSDGNNTYTARPSAIVAASSGTIIQTVYGQDNTEYLFSNPGSTSAPINKTSTLSINLKSASNKVLINVSVYGAGYAGTQYPGWGLWLLYNDNSIVLRQPYHYIGSNYVGYAAGMLSIIAQHTPNVVSPSYRLGIQKASAAGTTDVHQYSAYWTIQEITS